TFDVTGGFEHCRMRENRTVETHDVVALVHHCAPPVIFQVALQLDPERAVIPRAVEPAVNFARLKDEPAALAQAHNLFHALGVGRRAHYFGDRLTQIRQIKRRCRGACAKRLCLARRLTQTPLQRTPAHYVCGSTVTSVLTELAMKHCSCARWFISSSSCRLGCRSAENFVRW